MNPGLKARERRLEAATRREIRATRALTRILLLLLVDTYSDMLRETRPVPVPQHRSSEVHIKRQGLPFYTVSEARISFALHPLLPYQSPTLFSMCEDAESLVCPPSVVNADI
jgi:hypothetical protein